MGTLYSRANPLGYKQWAPGLGKAPLEPCILAPWFTQIRNAFCVFNYVIHYLYKVLLVISTKDGAFSVTYMMYILKTALKNSEIWDRRGFSKPRIVFVLSISKWLFAAAAVIFYILSLLLPLSLCFPVFSPHLNLFALVFLFLFSGCSLFELTHAVESHQLYSLLVWENLMSYFRKTLLILVDLEDTIRLPLLNTALSKPWTLLGAQLQGKKPDLRSKKASLVAGRRVGKKSPN